MITYIKEMIEVEKFQSVECDKCGRVETDNHLEIQEFHHVKFVGGYGSVFGDESIVECNICQRCLYNLIGDFCFIDGFKKEE